MALFVCFFLVGFLAGMVCTLLVRRRRVRQRLSLQESWSPLTKRLTPGLLGNHSPDIIEAAELLGVARDATAVPALIAALERCVETQPPGWSERATALANALGQIGDRRALPLLYRLDNVRGIGLISAVRNAISAIEPQTSLLRPGSADAATNHLLLRPVRQNPDPEAKATLLRSSEGE